MHRVAFAVLWKLFLSNSLRDQKRGTSQARGFALRSGTGTATCDFTPRHISAMLGAPWLPAFTLTVAMRRASSRQAPGPSLYGCCLCCAACCLLTGCLQLSRILFQHHHFPFLYPRKKHSNFSPATHKCFRTATPSSQCMQSSLSSAGTVNLFTPAKW